MRTKDKHEVDFALVKEDNVEQIIEVKSSEKEVSKSLHAFHKKYYYPAIQIVKNLQQQRMVDGIKVMKISQFLFELSL